MTFCTVSALCIHCILIFALTRTHSLCPMFIDRCSFVFLLCFQCYLAYPLVVFFLCSAVGEFPVKVNDFMANFIATQGVYFTLERSFVCYWEMHVWKVRCTIVSTEKISDLKVLWPWVLIQIWSIVSILNYMK